MFVGCELLNDLNAHALETHIITTSEHSHAFGDNSSYLVIIYTYSFAKTSIVVDKTFRELKSVS